MSRQGITHDLDGNYLFAAGEDGQIRGWNARTGHALDVEGQDPSDALASTIDLSSGLRGGGRRLIGEHPKPPAVAMSVTKSEAGDILHVAFADEIKSFQLGQRGCVGGRESEDGIMYDNLLS